MLTDNAPSTAPFLVGLQGNLFPIIAVGRIVCVIVAGADSNEENTEGGNRGGENSKTCLDGCPDCDRRTEPYSNWVSPIVLVLRGWVALTGEVLDLGYID
jgi:hypothetical protein